MSPPVLTLNGSWLRNRVAQLGLRQWWLAEQVGVDRKTVIRWINGQVRSIQPDNARVLAEVLGCRLDDLLLAEPTTGLASAEDQRAAGLALATSRLLDRLGPVGEWDVAERLIKASAVPDLPLHVLGRLYHQLCVACWRQDKLAEAEQYNQATLDIARRCDDRPLLGDALGSRANLAWWRGEVPAAMAAWHEALAVAPWLSPAQRGSLHSNLGASLVELGRIDEGQTHLECALQCFEEEGTPMQLSIARGHTALLALLRGDLDHAEHETRRSEALAQRADYRRGQAWALLMRALLAAQRGQGWAARERLAAAQQAYAAQNIHDALNEIMAARVWLHLGEAQAALQAAQAALAAPTLTPLEQVAAWREQAHALQALGQGDEAQRLQQQAQAQLARCTGMSPHVPSQAGDPPLP